MPILDASGWTPVPWAPGQRVPVAIAEGDVEEVSWQLGHKSSVVTHVVYRQEVKSAERTARRRAKMDARYVDVLRAAQTVPEESRTTVTPIPMRGP